MELAQNEKSPQRYVIIGISWLSMQFSTHRPLKCLSCHMALILPLPAGSSSQASSLELEESWSHFWQRQTQEILVPMPERHQGREVYLAAQASTMLWGNMFEVPNNLLPNTFFRMQCMCKFKIAGFKFWG